MLHINREWGIRILTCEGGIWPKVYLIELPSIGSSIPGRVLNCLHVIQFPVVVDRMLVEGGRTEWRIDSQFHGGLSIRDPLTVSSSFGGRARNGSLITFSFGPGNAFYCVSTHNCIRGEGSISSKSNTPPSSPSFHFDYISDTDTRLNLLLIWSG